MANDIVKKITEQSFWDKKEGTTGMIVGAAILGAIGYGAWKIMPHIVDLLQNTMSALILGAIAVILVYVLILDSTLRDRAWLLYKLLMEKITYSIIKYDPFGVLREMQARAQEKRNEVDEKRKQVNSQAVTIREELEAFNAEMQQVQSNVRWMQKNGKPAELIADEASKIGTLDESIKRMTRSYETITGFYKQMTRIYDELERFDKRVAWDIKMREREYKAINATASALEIMQAVIKGTDENSRMRDSVIAHLTNNYGEKLGRIESVMEDSSKFLEQADMRNAMYADRGLALLAELDKRDISISLPAPEVKKPVYNYK